MASTVDLSRLSDLKDKLATAEELSEIWAQFFDHFGEDPDFIALGKRQRVPQLQTCLGKMARQLFGGTSELSELRLQVLHQQSFAHGTCLLGGRLAAVLYFGDLEMGSLAVNDPSSGKVQFVRFTVRREAAAPPPSAEDARKLKDSRTASVLPPPPTESQKADLGSDVIRVVMMTELLDSARLIDSLGEIRACEIAARHDRLARDLLARYHGLEIDKSDAFLLLFERPADAVGYALAYHEELAGLSEKEGEVLEARVGIDLGEVSLRRSTPEEMARGTKPLEVEGAARLMSLAAGRQTLLSRGVFDLARHTVVEPGCGDRELCWLAHGTYIFQGVDEPAEIFEVGVRASVPLSQPAEQRWWRRLWRRW